MWIRAFAIASAVACVTLLVAPARSQEPASTPGVVHVLGLSGIPKNAKGELRVESGNLLFHRTGTGRNDIRFELPIARISDVFTGDDSQRVIRGALQALSTFAPYGGGRFLSLFRTKIDTLTIEYRDSWGGRHGVLFTLGEGKAIEVKKQLVAAGAPTSVPIEEETQKEEPKP